MSRIVPGYGPQKADIVIVGEAPGEDEELEGRPFVGVSGRLLSTLLREAGIKREDCYITNVCKQRPPGNDIGEWVTDKKKAGIANEWPCVNGRYISEQVQEGLATLYAEVASREPKIIVGLGNTALWAFTGEWGITDWRGSEIQLGEIAGACAGIAFVPTLHPAGCLRNWPTRAQLSHDLAVRVTRRIRTGLAVEPQWDFNIAPTLVEVEDFLHDMPNEVSVDVETSRGQIVCVGIAVSATKAMCIPFVSEGYGNYWRDSDDYVEVVKLLSCYLGRAKIIGQNFNYDASYFDENFGLRLYVAHDTKIAANVLFPGTPANLGFLSSMNCDWHRYWKDDARDWQNLRDFDRLFRYNCRDVCSTFEIAQKQKRALSAAKLETQFEERMRYNEYVLRMQIKGVIRDDAETARLEADIEAMLHAHTLTICDKAGRVVNPASPKQIGDLLFKDLGCRKPLRSAGGTGDDALEQIIKWHPEQTDLCTAVLEWRSLSSVRNNFLRAKLDPDGRLRSSFLSTGTETFRLTSSKNNFGRGTNLLNISSGARKENGINYRCAIVPPSGYTFFDCDLARADLQIVVWEADDADLKAKMREGVDIHTENAKDVFGVATPTPAQREMSKTFVHLTDYGGGARTAAIATGTTVHESDMAQRRWFAAHPGIKQWHERVRKELAGSRTVRNKFGYRITFFDRVDDAMFREALAWIPQSTVAIVASLVHMRMEDEANVEVMLQMYDSVAGVYATVDEDRMLPLLHTATQIVVPYDDPLIIPMGIKTSTKSWGDCKGRNWT